jgi:hypothetical protein
MDKLKKNFVENFLTERNKELHDEHLESLLIIFIAEVIKSKKFENKIQALKVSVPKVQL